LLSPPHKCCNENGTRCYRRSRILWFLVPKSNHEMQESRIPRTIFSVKPQNGSQKFLKSTFWAFFLWNFEFFFPIQIVLKSLHS
jgi:hypothetical protein